MKNKEAISELIKYRRRLEKNSTIDAEPFDMAIEALSTQKFGKWIDITKYAPNYECSECNMWSRYPSNYCPNCGAKMEEW